ncbi:MAG: hypothetical protein BRC58_04120 [Cyanobacteria bacterium QS_8_64_29]|nr:MAG: hypothetical protein BRC58_04120 [Cyanobacteria bacterium QS_8_64_29]
MRPQGLLVAIAAGWVLGAASAPELALAAEGAAPFRTIEQPLALKVGVTLGGIAAISLEFWWFRLGRRPAQAARAQQGVQSLTVTVDGGYQPDRAIVRAGQPVRLNFYRTDPNSCLERVLLPEFHRSAELGLNETTPIEFTPQQPGTYTFHCGMNMFRGTLEVQAPQA